PPWPRSPPGPRSSSAPPGSRASSGAGVRPSSARSRPRARAAARLADDAVAAGALGRVQVGVGAADELERVGERLGLAVAVDRRAPDRDRHREAIALVLEGLGADEGADLLGEAQGAVVARLRQDDRELLAAVAGEELLLADAAEQPPRELLEDVVAG